jgi:type II secretory pathway pseudopilin PulG
MPIFTAGAIAGQVQAAQAQQQQALFAYQKAIQQAFREVNDALVEPGPDARNCRRSNARSPRCKSTPAPPACATRTAIPATSKCSTPSAACSTSSCNTPRRSRRTVPGDDQSLQGHGRRLGGRGGKSSPIPPEQDEKATPAVFLRRAGGCDGVGLGSGSDRPFASLGQPDSATHRLALTGVKVMSKKSKAVKKARGHEQADRAGTVQAEPGGQARQHGSAGKEALQQATYLKELEKLEGRTSCACRRGWSTRD